MFKDRLKLARKRAGMTMAQLSSAMVPSVSPQAISKYEAGRMKPSLSVLVAIGKELDVSLDFLLGGQVASLDCVQWRKHSAAPARDLARAESLVIEKIENYLTIESILDIPSISDPFRGLRIESMPDEPALLEEQAGKLRMRWNLGHDPIPSMSGLLEEKGLMVVEADLPERINGLTCQAQCVEGPSIEAIIISSHTNVERKRFNLAHELAHRVIAPGNGAGKGVERAMNVFAGAFLMPREHLLGETGKDRAGMTVREVLRLKRIYGVSAAAMLMRLGQTGVLSMTAIEHAFRGFARSWRTEEPEPLGPNEGFALLEKPRRFESLVWRALGEWLISPLRAAELLDLSLDEIEHGIRRIHAP